MIPVQSCTTTCRLACLWEVRTASYLSVLLQDVAVLNLSGKPPPQAFAMAGHVIPQPYPYAVAGVAPVSKPH